jgi:hypothetical protein
MRRLVALALLALSACAQASDHLDTPQVIADPRTDIGDIYAWPSADWLKLNLVMTIVGHSFARDVDYVFHVDSGARYGATGVDAGDYCGISRSGAGESRRAGAGCMGGDFDQGEAHRSHGPPADRQCLAGATGGGRDQRCTEDAL